MSGASQVNKGDPRDRAAIEAFLASGGEVTRVPPNRHGECLHRRGIQIGNGNARKATPSVEDAIRSDQLRQKHREQNGSRDSEVPF